MKIRIFCRSMVAVAIVGGLCILNTVGCGDSVSGPSASRNTNSSPRRAVIIDSKVIYSPDDMTTPTDARYVSQGMIPPRDAKGWKLLREFSIGVGKKPQSTVLEGTYFASYSEVAEGMSVSVESASDQLDKAYEDCLSNRVVYQRTLSDQAINWFSYGHLRLKVTGVAPGLKKGWHVEASWNRGKASWQFDDAELNALLPSAEKFTIAGFVGHPQTRFESVGLCLEGKRTYVTASSGHLVIGDVYHSKPETTYRKNWLGQWQIRSGNR